MIRINLLSALVTDIRINYAIAGADESTPRANAPHRTPPTIRMLSISIKHMHHLSQQAGPAGPYI